MKVDKVEETRAEAAAKAAAAEKMLAANADAADEGAAMETEDATAAAETPAAGAATAAEPAGESTVGMDVEEAAEGGDAATAKEDEKEPAELVKELTAFQDPELPENKTGWYELVAILTHKGQNADGGHYVAWVQHKEDVWVCFDDDKVTRIGPHWHNAITRCKKSKFMPLLLFYERCPPGTAIPTGYGKWTEDHNQEADPSLNKTETNFPGLLG